MGQMTKDDAIRFYESGQWKHMTNEQIAKFQIQEERLCVPFDVFHRAVEKTLGRSVWTHEFGLNNDGLRNELFHGAEPPTMQQIIEQIPGEKRVIVSVSDHDPSEN